MTFLRFKKCKFSPIFSEVIVKTQKFCNILERLSHSTWKWFEKLNHISFVFWAVTEDPNFRVFVIFLARPVWYYLIYLIYLILSILFRLLLICIWINRKLRSYVLAHFQVASYQFPLSKSSLIVHFSIDNLAIHLNSAILQANKSRLFCNPYNTFLARAKNVETFVMQ